MVLYVSERWMCVERSLWPDPHCGPPLFLTAGRLCLYLCLCLHLNSFLNWSLSLCVWVCVCVCVCVCFISIICLSSPLDEKIINFVNRYNYECWRSVSPKQFRCLRLLASVEIFPSHFSLSFFNSVFFPSLFLSLSLSLYPSFCVLKKTKKERKIDRHWKRFAFDLGCVAFHLRFLAISCRFPSSRV